MIGVQHYQPLLQFFDGVDAVLSRKFLRHIPPDEIALTGDFCALMDAETQRREQDLKFSLDHLNAALAACGDDLTLDFRIQTRPHTPKMEHHVSQSDLGIVIEINNYILPEESGFFVYFLQAKKLHSGSATGEFDDSASFRSIDKLQHNALLRLANKFGDDYFKYILYCPPVSGYTKSSAAKLRALHTRNFSKNIFDFSSGLSLFDYIKGLNGKIESGVWLTPIDKFPTKPADLARQAFESSLPLSWFFLQNFIDLGTHLMISRDEIGHLRDYKQNRNARLIRDVANGERAAIEEFLEAVAESDPADIPKPRILPASTITITATVGGSLPEDSRRAFVED